MRPHVSLWDAINRYVVACGGNPSRYVHGNTPRMTAVVDAERYISIVARFAFEAGYSAGVERGHDTAQVRAEVTAELVREDLRVRELALGDCLVGLISYHKHKYDQAMSDGVGYCRVCGSDEDDDWHYVCEVCEDTHMMLLGERDVMCTRCPNPCESCRQHAPGRGGGPYCQSTPCACACHKGKR